MDMNFNQHISAQFNADLDAIRNHMMAMGGVIEQQVNDAIEAICDNNTELAELVNQRENDVNQAEIDIDQECTQILVRRQPAASDLRMVLAVSRVIRDLERIGDEASKIATLAIESTTARNQHICRNSINYMGIEVNRMICGSLNAFARNDVEGAIEVVRNDRLVDTQYAAALREIMTYMMEDPRSISEAINILWVLRSIERIGDHARNIAEQVIYVVSGQDVRHSSLKEIENSAQIEESKETHMQSISRPK